jgi:predicted adenine nucleotide alpha hydrolase (AANH) superfamily ATPase
VDSWYFLAKLREKRPSEMITGFFYNPNICPRNEYMSRLIDAKRRCDRLKIAFIEGEYDTDSFLLAARGLENEPEKGARCARCFDLRLERTAREGTRLGEKSFSSTLLISPKKDLIQLKAAAQRIAKRYDLEFVFEDFRKNGGTQAAFALAREKEAYFQNYCGCAWALIKQRAAQGRFAAELICPIDGAKTACDLRLEAISERARRENAGETARLYKTKIMEWRLLSGSLIDEGGSPIACDIAPYSASANVKTRLIALSEYAARFEKSAGFVTRRSFADKNDAREALGLSARDITPIFVVEDLPKGVVVASIESALYQEDALICN